MASWPYVDQATLSNVTGCSASDPAVAYQAGER